MNQTCNISKNTLIRAIGAQETHVIIKERYVVNEYFCQNCADCTSKCTEESYDALATTTDEIFKSQKVCPLYKRKIDFLRKAKPDESNDYIFKKVREEMMLATYEEKYAYFKALRPTSPAKELDELVLAAFTCSDCSALTKESQKTYVNEYNRYQISSLERNLSSIELKLLIYLHFKTDSFGMAQNVDLVAAAKEIKCNIKSVKRGLDNLQALNYVAYSYQRRQLKTNHATIYLVDYTKAFLPATKGGRGYIVMLESFFKRIVESSYTVNEIRALIRVLIKDDDNNFRNDNKKASDLTDETIERKETVLVYEDTKRFFEPYLRYPKKIKELLSKVDQFFEVSTEAFFGLFNLKKDFNGKLVRAEQLYECFDRVCELNEQLQIIATEEDAWGIASLFRKHGEDLVTAALYKVKCLTLKEPKKLESIFNFTGYVYSIIKNLKRTSECSEKFCA